MPASAPTLAIPASPRNPRRDTLTFVARVSAARLIFSNMTDLLCACGTRERNFRCPCRPGCLAFGIVVPCSIPSPGEDKADVFFAVDDALRRDHPLLVDQESE